MRQTRQRMRLLGLGLALAIGVGASSMAALAGTPSQPAAVSVASQAAAGEPADSSLAAAPTESQAVPSADPGAASQPASSPFETAPTTSTPTFRVLPGGSTVIPVEYYSQSLQKKTWYEVVLPPGYAATDESYPVLYMLHGAMGGAHEWIDIGIADAADRLWSEGALEPFLIALPEGGQMTYWLNHADNGPRYGDLVTQDIVHEIDASFRTLPQASFRAIGGLSMGGDAALRLALGEPDVFTIVGAHSPTTRQQYEDRPGPFYGDFSYWQQNNALWLIQNTDSARRLTISIDVGDMDPWVFSGRALDQALSAKGVQHRYLEIPGAHEAEYWVDNQAAYLEFYSQAFQQSLLASRPRTPAATP